MVALKSIAPNFIKQSLLRDYYYNCLFLINLLKNYSYDFRRFLIYSATQQPYKTQQRHQGRIIAHYHQIEKGLSLKNTRVGFGQEVVRHLVNMLQTYQQNYGADEVTQVALDTLFAYYKFNLEAGHDNPELYQQLTALQQIERQEPGKIGGTIPVTREQIHQAISGNFQEFVHARHSVRQFDTTKAVDPQAIEQAVAMAIKTPSVCNRQTWKVYRYSDLDAKKRILAHQNGNRGFGDSASQILIVTSDLNYFMTPAERHQCFIDGGMFAMSLVYGLHSLGLGSCCLNWSADYKRDLALKAEAEIPAAESVIMMIAVGHLPETFVVASSPRKDIAEVLISE
ncbi:MAG: nitroreductase family protein [Cyanobacteria bacterium P01_C01_bin.72]